MRRNWRGLLYVIVDVDTEVAYIRELLIGGVDWLQLRMKTESDRIFLERAEQVVRLCRRYRRTVFINDRPDIAWFVSADGVHLGQDDIPPRVVRKRWKGLVGLSTHSEEEACRGMRQPVDYLAVGPLYPTETKPKRPAVGNTLLQRIRRQTRRPLVAIGGIELDRLPAVFAAGADIVCVYRALQNRKNPRDAVHRWKRAITKVMQ